MGGAVFKLGTMEPHYRRSDGSAGGDIRLDVRFVLVAPSHVGNIGASARAIATMGYERLVVVSPQDPAFRAAPEARALAVGAVGLLDAARACETLDEALAGCSLAFAMSGYDREFGPPLCDVRTAAGNAARHLASGLGDVAFVFGTERAGLSNRDVDRCHYCCAIPASPEHASLNLAQAVQVAAYECRMATLPAAVDMPSVQSRFESEPPASSDQIEAMIGDLERGLVALGVIDPAQPRRTMPRLRRLLGRALPSAADVSLLRGIFGAMVERKAERAGQRRDPGAASQKPMAEDQSTGCRTHGSLRQSR